MKNNGFNPIFKFSVSIKLNCPELAFIYIKVMDKDVIMDTRLGINVLSANSLRVGYRVIPLYDSKLNIIDNSYLLTHVQIKWI